MNRILRKPNYYVYTDISFTKCFLIHFDVVNIYHRHPLTFSPKPITLQQAVSILLCPPTSNLPVPKFTFYLLSFVYLTQSKSLILGLASVPLFDIIILQTLKGILLSSDVTPHNSSLNFTRVSYTDSTPITYITKQIRFYCFHFLMLQEISSPQTVNRSHRITIGSSPGFCFNMSK